MCDSIHSFQAYIIFQNSLGAFATQRVLSSPLFADFSFTLQLVPTPKEYSKNCTLSVFLEWSEDSKKEGEFIESIGVLLAQKHIKHDIIRL